MGQINTNNYPTVNSLLDADLLIVENATHGTGTTTPKQLRENAIGTDTLHTSAQSVTGAINELKGEIDAGAGVVCYDVDTITSGYLGGQFSGSANLLLLHLTTDGTADATNGYMMMLSYSRPVARFAYGRLVDADGVAYKQDVYADNTIICKISNSGEGTESDPEQVVILGIINAGFMLTPTAVVSDRDIIDGQGNTLSVLAEALTKTASGNPVVISDCAGGKARSLITEINAIQDLHGYDKPWVGGSYKNKFPITVENLKALNTTGTWSGNVYTVSGGTITIVTDDGGNVTGIKANGTFNADVYMLLASVSALNSILSGSYILNGCPSGGGESTYYIRIGSSGTDGGTGANVSTPFTGTNSYIFIKSGYTANNHVFKPMIRLASESDPAFAPYSNICPISGRTAVAITRTGENISTGVESGTFGTDGVNNANPNRCRTVGYVPLDSNKHYLAQSNVSNLYIAVSYFASNVSGIERISGTGWESLPYSFTPPNGCHYVRCMFSYNSGAQTVINPIDLSDFMLLEDATDFTIQLGQTVYGGTVNLVTGAAIVTHALQTLDKNLTWRKGVNPNTPAGRYIYYFTEGLTGCKPAGSDSNPNNLYMKSNVYDISNTSYGSVAYKTYFSLGIGGDSNIATIGINTAFSEGADFLTWLDNNPVQIWYPLATPIELTLTPTELQMLKGYNRVAIESGSIELGYIAKLT